MVDQDAIAMFVDIWVAAQLAILYSTIATAVVAVGLTSKIFELCPLKVVTFVTSPPSIDKVAALIVSVSGIADVSKLKIERPT